ncbi:FAD-dependent oxidoreductase [Segnochrobactraceae bacterium EtOH-i3]
MSSFSRLMQPIRLGSCEIRNRIVLTGHGTGMGVDGAPDDRMVAYYEERARGEVGLIMLGSQQVHPSSPGITGLICNYDDRILPGLARVAEAVHRHGGKVFGYLSHMGFATTARPVPLWSASATYEQKYGEVAHAMTEAEIAEVTEAFAAAAERCLKAGLDGVQVHCGHGLLLQQFLSPLTNHRADRYGGSVENRTRFPRAVLAAVRARIGPDAPLGIRCSGSELVEGGLTADDMAVIVPMLVDAGALDYVDVSAGTDGDLVSNMLHEPPMGLDPAPFVSIAAKIRAAVSVPVIHGTRIHTAEVAEKMLAQGEADIAGMCRALIADPHLPKKIREGRLDEVIPCIGCEQACFGRLYRGRHISCLGNPVTGRERAWARPAPAPAAKRLMVIGGGPGGMEAARVAAARGHRVTLIEAAGHLGGRLDLARRPPGREEWTRLIDARIAELARLGVTVRLNETVTPELVASERPDAVVLATGALARRPAIPGIDDPRVIPVDAAVSEPESVGPRVLILDHLDRQPAMVTAVMFAERGHAVTLATPSFHVGMKLEIQNITFFYRRALGAGVVFRAVSDAVAIAPDGRVTFRNPFTGLRTEDGPWDTIILAVPGRPRDELVAGIAALGIDCRVIGDAYAPRDTEAAILDGHAAGLAC